MSIRYIYFTIILIVFLGLSGTVPVYAVTTGKVESTEQSSVNKLVNSSTESDQPITDKSVKVNSKEMARIEASFDSAMPNIGTAKTKIQKQVKEDVNGALEKQIYKKIKDKTLGYAKGSTITWTSEDFPLVYKNLAFEGFKYIANNGNSVEQRSGMFYADGSFEVPTIKAMSTEGSIQLTYDAVSKKGTLTRMKNKKIVVNTKDEPGEWLLISTDVSFKTATMFKSGDGRYVNVGTTAIPSIHVDSEIWFTTANYLTPIILEEPVALSAKTVSEAKLTTTSTLPNTPAEYITVESRMAGSKLTYQWVTKPDLTKVGIQTVKVKVTDQLDDYIHDQTIDLKINVSKGVENLQSITTKDSELYVGESWSQSDNFVGATDEAGKSIPWEDSRITSNSANVDTSKPGVYNLKYSFKGTEKTSDSSFTVTVKEDKSSIRTKDSELYVGESWSRSDNFVGATDEAGKSIPWEDPRITSNSANVDTSKPGVYNLKYGFKGKVKTTEETFKVTVKDDQTKLELQNVELFVGETWDPNSPFKDVKDKDGNTLYAKDFTNYYIYPVGEQAADKWVTKELNTEVVGNYEVRLYHFPSKQWSTRARVTVKNIPITLTVPESHTFGEMQLGKNEKLYWNKAEKIKVINDGNRKWQLSAKLLTSNNLDFPNYIRFKGQFFTKDEILIDTGDTTKTITDELTTDKFIYVDYSDVKQLRKDVATLEWALTPSTKELIE
ncbi:bacterial Ig-like domain-containing protein [Brochothrix thermosphacta]|uniref:bacterial Ig-like domain-containing protein n=1 Tax=Brochothrix thermosphacta TaxID=2756 RepID=UPI000EBA8C3F|nr:bacterial Ig-like domain-containing protein [Brochothrix thermosphacta]HCZ39665.1 hypothetical protein [Brochothrix thermosphacta]HCZ45490.1 hypothetical protein [Brochothrix thermosphacta]